jgi:hypothetical protein
LNHISFPSIDFSANALFKITEKLGIVGFDRLRLQEYLIPTTLEQCFSFLEYNFSSRLKTLFEKSIKIVAIHFYQIEVDVLEKFSFNVLEHILSSPSLKIQNETNLFQILIKLIESKSNYFSLLQYVYFCFVDSNVLNKFFSTITLYVVDFELFNIIKLNISHSQSISNSETRWIDESIIFTNETILVLQLLLILLVIDFPFGAMKTIVS